MGKITVHGLLTCLLENLFKNYVSEIYIQDLLLSNFQSFAHNLLTDDVERNISFFFVYSFCCSPKVNLYRCVDVA